MRELGYGDGYRYDHDDPDGVAEQDYLPPELADASFYRPSRFGHEATIRKRLDWWAERRRKGAADGSQPDPGGDSDESSGPDPA